MNYPTFIYKGMGNSWSNGLGGTIAIDSTHVKITVTNHAVVGLPMYIHIYYQSSTSATANITGSGYTDLVSNWKINNGLKFLFARITPTSTGPELIVTSSDTIGSVTALVIQ